METPNQIKMESKMKLIFSGIIIAIAVAFLIFSFVFNKSDSSLFAFSGDRPTNLGINDGKLTDCPSTPNCVSSQASDPEHQILPIPFSGEPGIAFASLIQLVSASDRTKIITVQDNYLYAETSSRLMGFVDDLEFIVDSEKQIINLRSASRMGESDLGVNRQRIEQIRSQFAASIKS
jgi:uncharacterized protein (DUF1499 family)